MMSSQDADKGIMKMLKEKGRMVHQSTITHSYPFCWRSDSHSTSSFPIDISIFLTVSFK